MATSVTADSEGNKIYGWTYAHATAFSVGQGKSLVVKVNKDGVVDSYIVALQDRSMLFAASLSRG
jgi:hypothetical protein